MIHQLSAAATATAREGVRPVFVANDTADGFTAGQVYPAYPTRTGWRVRNDNGRLRASTSSVSFRAVSPTEPLPFLTSHLGGCCGVRELDRRASGLPWSRWTMLPRDPRGFVLSRGPNELLSALHSTVLFQLDEEDFLLYGGQPLASDFLETYDGRGSQDFQPYAMARHDLLGEVLPEAGGTAVNNRVFYSFRGRSTMPTSLSPRPTLPGYCVLTDQQLLLVDLALFRRQGWLPLATTVNPNTRNRLYAFKRTGESIAAQESSSVAGPQQPAGV